MSTATSARVARRDCEQPVEERERGGRAGESLDPTRHRRTATAARCAYAWALPTTSVGLCFVPLAMLGGGMQWVDGVLELYGGPVGFFLRRCTLLKGGASAMTLGHVVLGRDRDALAWTRAHQRVHVRQCERWGPLFLPAYLAGSMIAVLRGRRAYRDNPFEREGTSGRRTSGRRTSGRGVK